MERPVIAIPLGDPAGIGPEIVLKALKNKELYTISKPLVIGNIDVLNKIDKNICAELSLNVIDQPQRGKYIYGTVDIISIGELDADRIRFGEIQEAAGKAAFQYITKAVELANEKKINAIATTPINKEAIKAANIDFIGHTEMLAAMTGTDDPLTMFQVYDLRVFFLSRHVSLRKACDLVKKERLVNYIEKCDVALKKLGLNKRKIAIAGLNPHSGEHGLFGDEEGNEIEPAIKILRDKGIDVVGPIAADSVFYLGLKGLLMRCFLYITTRGTLLLKWWILKKPYPLPSGCRF